jgi:hypothetical protein
MGDLGLLLRPCLEMRQIGGSSGWLSILDVNCGGYRFGAEFVWHRSMLQHRLRWIKQCAIGCLRNAILLL